MKSLSRKTIRARWQAFAATNKFIFTPGSIFGEPDRLVGYYRGYRLNMKARHWLKTVTHISLTLYPTDEYFPVNKDIPSHQLVVKNAVNRFSSSGWRYPLVGDIEIEARGGMISYTQNGLISYPEYLHFLLYLLSDLANAYRQVIILGGEALPALLEVALLINYIILTKSKSSKLAMRGLSVSPSRRATIPIPPANPVISRCVAWCRHNVAYRQTRCEFCDGFLDGWR